MAILAFCFRLSVSWALLSLVGATDLYGQMPEVRKIAFVVGVSPYSKDGFSDLKYAEADANDVAAELKKLDFSVTIVIGKDATRANLEKQLKQFIRNTGELNKGDIAVVMLTGHGMQCSVPDKGQQIEEPFFCPVDAMKNTPGSLLSINWVLDELTKNSGSSQNLLLIDACRSNPARGAKGVDGNTVRQLEDKLSVLFSSSSGQASYESDTVKHGVFTYVLLQGLRGAAANGRGDVTWLSLADYTMNVLPKKCSELTGDSDLKQSPNLVGNFRNNPVFASNLGAAARPDATVQNTNQDATVERSDNGMHMTLVKCSPNKLPQQVAPAVALAADEFWLGKFEVTQAEWQQLMGNNPSYFSADGRGASRVSGKDTSRFPVEQVSYDDVLKFCTRFNDTETQAGRLREGWQYRLPNSAEWELAARVEALAAPAGNKRLAGWFQESSEGRSHEIGSVAGDANRILDMRGNVAEWCLARPGDRPSVRGGCWVESAVAIGEDEREVQGGQGRNCYGFRLALIHQPSVQISP